MADEDQVHVDLVVSDQSTTIITENGTWTLTHDQLQALMSVMDRMQSHPDTAPDLVTPVVEALEQRLHTRRCGCDSWPASCTTFGVVNGQIEPGTGITVMPSRWTVAEVLAEVERQTP